MKASKTPATKSISSANSFKAFSLNSIGVPSSSLTSDQPTNTFLSASYSETDSKESSSGLDKRINLPVNVVVSNSPTLVSLGV